MPKFAGLLFPESVLQSDWFAVFATFVAINTVIYVALSVSKLFPVIRFRRRGFRMRAQERSIYPTGRKPEGSQSAGSEVDIP